ncbi:hypothetical protein VNI00_005770 [Paramarasmius palmivorus]|uniref:Uncharacterized protein n=1 Tax=Paramarasmius palmivorus TaxID=297713 RepID=A0AAW0DEZ3_9AGAR
MVITRQIVPRSIPRERHVANGPRVLQNIIPPTSWKRGTLSPSNHKRRGQKSPVTEDEYEFITYRASASYRPSTSAKVDKLGNLPSTLVSELVGGGLTLWKDGVRVALGDEKRVMESEIKETPATEITPVQ